MITGRLETFRAQVYATESRIDPNTLTLTVRALYPNTQGELIPGRYADIQHQTGRNQRCHRHSLGSHCPEMGKNKVLSDRSGKAEPVEVALGIRTEAEVQILKGLAAGDTIITSGTLQLRKGMSVVIDQLN